MWTNFMWEEAPFKNMQKSLGDIGVVARGFFGKFEFLFLFSDNMENMDTNSQQNISHFLGFLKIFEKWY